MNHAIEAEGVYRDFGSVRALAGLDLRVAQGSVFGFLGPNGAGKTTTLHVLLGMLVPDAGHVRVLGLDPATQGGAVRARCGALLEHHGLYEALTPRENLEFQARLHRMPRVAAKARIREVMEAAGFWDRRDDRLGTWSRGMKQRLAVLRAFLPRPQIVFLDEPTAGFDPKAAVDLRTMLQDAARVDGTTVFLNTHNLAEAEAICDNVAVIHEGHILASGAPAELLGDRPPVLLRVEGDRFPPRIVAAIGRRKGVLSVEVRDDGLAIGMEKGVPAHPLVRALVEAGAEVEAVHRSTANLEEDFITLLEQEGAEVHA